MCGRLEIGVTSQMRELLGSLNLPLFPTLHNIAPTETVPVIIKQNDIFELHQMRWWLTPAWAPEPTTKFSMFNAKAETIQESNAFRDPFKKHRFVIPVSAYYEWQTKGKVKTPFRISSDSPMMLAGIWDVWHRDEGTIHSCAIITTEAVPELSWLHTRQPIFIPEIQLQEWCASKTPLPNLGQFLLPHLPFTLAVTPVDSAVGNSRYKGEVAATGDPIIIEH